MLNSLQYEYGGNLGLFPAVRFHHQDWEMAYATGRHMAQGFFSYAYEVDEVVAMVREAYKGRVRFHDGDAELAPGLSLHRIGGHTEGPPGGRARPRGRRGPPRARPAAPAATTHHNPPLPP